MSLARAVAVSRKYIGLPADPAKVRDVWDDFVETIPRRQYRNICDTLPPHLKPEAEKPKAAA